MKVSAKWQLAYKSVGYKAGDVFEIDDKDFQLYKNDVVIVSSSDWRKPVTKATTSQDTFNHRKEYESETGKKSFWMGKLTNGYLSWLKNK